MFLLLFAFAKSYAQFDTKHYLPPIYIAAISDSGANSTAEGKMGGTVKLIISTCFNNGVLYSVYHSDGTLYNSGTCTSGGSAILTLESSRAYTTSGIAFNPDSTFIKLNTKGLIVDADEPVCVNLIENTADYDRWSLSSKGQTALGKKSYTGHIFHELTNNPNVISIIATEVQYTLNTGVTLYNGATGSGTYSIMLNAGQSYIIIARINGVGLNEELNGTIKSDKDIVVVSGSYSPYVGAGAGYSGCDVIIIPTDVLESNYVVQYGKCDSYKHPEQVYVAVAYDKTAILVDSTYVTTITSGGDIITLKPGDLSEISAYVHQESGGGLGKRGMPIVPRLQCRGILYSEFLSLASTANLNIMAMTGATIVI